MKPITIFLLIVIVASLLIGGGYYYQNIRIQNLKESVNFVRYDSDFVDTMNEKYTSTEIEFVFCLRGKIKNNVAIIEDFYMAEAVSAGEGQIQFSSCNRIIELNPNDISLGTIHNHPNGICHLGEQDLYTFGALKDSLAGIICGEDNFNFFTRKSLIKSIEVK